MQHVLQILNPLHKRWFYALPHLIVVLLIIAGYFVAFGAGYWTGTHYGPSWFRAHNSKFLPLKKTKLIIPATGTGVAANSAWAHTHFLPEVINQWNTNSCVEAETAAATSYDVNTVTHTRADGTTYHRHVRYSGLALYNWVNGTKDAATGGDGTNPEQAELAVNTHGLIRHRLYDYPASPPVPFRSVPPSLPTEWHHMWLNWLFAIQPGKPIGQKGLDAIDGQIVANRGVGVALEAYDGPSGIYSAGTTGVYDTAHLTTLLGGHMIFVVGFDKEKVINGVRGWYFAQQSYGKNYGLTRTGKHQTNGTGGYFWVSRRLVSRYAYEATVTHLGTHPDVWPASGKATGVGAPGAADGHRRPMAPQDGLPVTGIGNTTSWIRPYYTTDTHVDVSPIINAAASYYGLPATFVLAVVMAESGGKQYAYRHTSNVDWSCGLMQQILSNIASYEGITNPDAACAWEDVPANSIWLGAKILRGYWNDYGVPPPSLWQCYNSGSYCNSPYYAGFLANYYVALTYGGAVYPQHTPFPIRQWCQYRASKKKPCFSHQWHGKRSWAAAIMVAHPGVGSPTNQGHWYRGGYTKYGYTKAVAFCWPRYHRCKIVMRVKTGVGAQSVAQCQTQGTGCARVLTNIINAHRAAAGVGALTLNWTLIHGTATCQGATKHAAAMAQSGFIWHVNPAYPQNSFPADICIPYMAAGQNAGEYPGARYPAMLMLDQMMMAEVPPADGHRENLLSPSYHQIGVGFVSAGGATWMVEDFTS